MLINEISPNIKRNGDLLTGTARYVPHLEENNSMKSLQSIKTQRLTIMFILLVVCVWGFSEGCNRKTEPNTHVDFTELRVLDNAFRSCQSDLQVTQQGEIIRILPDDTKGSQHQRFIVKLTSGQTLLIAHNIDIAPRVIGVTTGEIITFHGEYEWNEKGGVIHWTHHDPDGRHEDGWLEYQGKKYQ